jgi:hypothetical protein
MATEKTRKMNMDFKKLISHIESIDGAIDTPKAPTLADPIRLDEDTEFRVLAGVTKLTESMIMEKAVSKSQQQAAGAALAAKRGEGKAVGASKEMMKMGTKELEKIAGTKHKGLPEKKTDESVEVAEAEMKVGDKKKSSTGGTIEKTKTGVKHTAKEYDGEDHSEPAQKKASKAGMSGAERKEQSAKDKAEEKKGKEWEAKHGKGSVTRHKMEDVEIDKEKFQEKFTKMVEAAKPDFLDIDKDGDKKEPMKKAAKEKGGEKKDGKKEMSDKQKKFFGKKNESISKEVKKKAKKVVAESVETKMSFRDMMKLVVESGGQQQIDPVDTALFNWASRVAKNKLGEGMKAEVYAGMIYERNGGCFEMYDILSEEKN